MKKLPKTVERTIQEFQKLPGIGRKGAERIVFHLFTSQGESVLDLAQAIRDLKEKVRLCPLCFNLTENAQCEICSDTERDRTRICVVETVADLIALEKHTAYNGLYHILQGRLAPLEGKTQHDIRIRELEDRIQSNPDVKEIIIATTTGLEGETTSMYLVERLKHYNITISRIGLGIPAGSSLEYADELTLRKAIEARKKI